MPEALQSADDIKAAMMNLDGESSTPTLDGTQPTPAAAPAAAEPPAPAAAAPAASAEPAKPSAAAEPEPDFETGDDLEGKDWKVPGEKLQAQVKRRKEAEQKADEAAKRAEEAEARLAEIAAKDTPGNDPADPNDGDDDVEVDPVLLKALKKQGFMTRAEAEKLAEEKATGVLSADKATAARQQQAVQDRQELTQEFAGKGYPAFDVTAVLPKAIEMVGEKNLSKEVLRAAYLEQNAKEIENIMIKQANANLNRPDASAERSGGAPKGGTSAEATPQSTPDKIKAGIAAAIPD